MKRGTRPFGALDLHNPPDVEQIGMVMDEKKRLDAIRNRVNVLPSSGRVMGLLSGSVAPWYHPAMMKQSAANVWSGVTSRASRVADWAGSKISPEARIGAAMRWNVATTNIAPPDWGGVAGRAAGFAYDVANPALRGDALLGAADAVVEGAFKTAGVAGKFPGVGFMRRNPRTALVGLMLGGTALATAAVGAGGAHQAMTMNRMHMMHSAQQRQQIEQSVMPRGTRNTVQSTFSGRRVKGGHLGASGDLVFAMHNRR